MAKLGDWERTVWRNRQTAEEEDDSLLCRWRDGPTRQRLEYHYLDQFLEKYTGMDVEEFFEQLPEDEEENFSEDDGYIIVFGEDADGVGGEVLRSASTRSDARSTCADLMKNELHPENLFPERYEEEEPADIPEDLEEVLDEESEVDYDYSEIQDIAKTHDIKANQSTEDLIEALVEIRDGEQEAEVAEAQ